jgi:hypothetical protein
MKTLTPKQILGAFDDGLEITSRWPRLLRALGFDPDQGRPGVPLINRELKRRGFRPVLDDTRSTFFFPYQPYPEEWWQAVAREITGDRDASGDRVVRALGRQQAPTRHAGE